MNSWLGHLVRLIDDCWEDGKDALPWWVTVNENGDLVKKWYKGLGLFYFPLVFFAAATADGLTMWFEHPLCAWETVELCNTWTPWSEKTGEPDRSTAAPDLSAKMMQIVDTAEVAAGDNNVLWGNNRQECASLHSWHFFCYQYGSGKED